MSTIGFFNRNSSIICPTEPGPTTEHMAKTHMKNQIRPFRPT